MGGQGLPIPEGERSAHVSTTTDIYSHVIKKTEERISDCVADVILKPAKAKLRVVRD